MPPRQGKKIFNICTNNTFIPNHNSSTHLSKFHLLFFKVFEELSGSCKLAKDVPECSNYYGANVQSSEASRAQATKLQNIEDDIQKQFNDERLRLRQLRVKRWIMEEEVKYQLFIQSVPYHIRLSPIFNTKINP